MADIKNRDEIDPRYTWDLSCMFADDDAFAAALDAARDLPAAYASHQATATSSAQGLLDFLQFDDVNGVLLEKLGNYAERRHDEDTRIAKYQDWSSQFVSLVTAISASAAWFTPQLLAVPDDRLAGWFDEQPALEPYRRKIEKVRRLRDHVLPVEQEALLAAAGEMAAQPENTFSMFNDADLTFPDAVDANGQAHQVTHGSYIPLMLSGDRTLRQSAFESLYGTYRTFRNTSAAILGSQVKTLKFFSDAHRYGSALEASLFPTEVPVEVYTNLIDSVHANMGAMHRYVDLRRRLLGVDELHYWDLYAPMVSDVDMRFTYEEACDVMLQALAPLGEDYLAIVQKGLEQRWIDVYENPGKRSGAYSAGGYGMHPVILLNFHGTLDDVFTLVHEMGHSVHTYLACSKQPPTYSQYEMFVAEVASTTNECLLLQWLLEHAGDGVDEAEGLRRRAYLVNHYLEQFRTTLYRQTMFAEFERDVNEMAARGEGITADSLCERYAALNAGYFGPDICPDDGIALEWARIPHFYYDFYVYVYATSFSASVALSQRILNEGPAAVEKYLAFLAGGSSQPPIDLLRGAGVDMADRAPIDSALGVFSQLVDEMAALAEQMGA